MSKITNERLQQMSNELTKLPLRRKRKEDGTLSIEVFNMDATDYEFACFIIHKLTEIDLHIEKEYEHRKPKQKNQRENYTNTKKTNFLNLIRNYMSEEQCIELLLIKEGPLLYDHYDNNNDYVEIFNKCIKTKQNTELNMKLQATLPNKQIRLNNKKM